MKFPTFVLDASVALTWVLPDQMTTKSLRWKNRALDADVFVCTHWPIEVVNILAIYRRRGVLSTEQVTGAYHQFEKLNLQMDDKTIERLREATFDLALRHTLSIYDAAYLELAQRLNAPLATLDKKLAAAAAAEGIETE